MAARDSVDLATRLNIAAHLRRLKAERGIRSAAALARRLGVHEKTMPRYLRGDQGVGLDVALRIHREFGVSLDTLVDEKPDQKWFTYDPERDGEIPDDAPGPGGVSRTSPSTAHSARRGVGQ